MSLRAASTLMGSPWKKYNTSSIMLSRLTSSLGVRAAMSEPGLKQRMHWYVVTKPRTVNWSLVAKSRPFGQKWPNNLIILLKHGSQDLDGICRSRQDFLSTNFAQPRVCLRVSSHLNSVAAFLIFVSYFQAHLTFCTATIASLIWVWSNLRSCIWRSLRTAVASARADDSFVAFEESRNW